MYNDPKEQTVDWSRIAKENEDKYRQEKAYLEKFCCEQKAELDRMQQKINNLQKELERKNQTISSLTSKVKFLEGQIEAYQYCMNCKR